MKKYFFLFILMAAVADGHAQEYPEPEFSNEIYNLRKDTSYKLIRLEKATSEINTTHGMMKGAEVGYSISGSKSPVRLERGELFSFVYSIPSNGSSDLPGSSPARDSMMRANGMDPAMMQHFTSTGSDQVQSLILYKLDAGKGERKIILQKSPGANPFGSHKIISSEKYTFSTKKIRNGYLVFIVDKQLPKGEYAFTINQGGMNVMGGILIFAFGVD